MEYYSAIKKNELLVYATMWMYLKKHYDNKKKPDIKDSYYMTSLIGNAQKTQIY